jgi:hypothetical protein
LSKPPTPPPPIAFDGETYKYLIDFERMDTLFRQVWDIMEDNRWHYPAELEDALRPHLWASLSARVRDPRKLKWGEHLVLSEPRGNGLWRYKLIPRGSPAWKAMDPDLLEELLTLQRLRRVDPASSEFMEGVMLAIRLLRGGKPIRALALLESLFHESADV